MFNINIIKMNSLIVSRLIYKWKWDNERLRKVNNSCNKSFWRVYVDNEDPDEINNFLWYYQTHANPLFLENFKFMNMRKVYFNCLYFNEEFNNLYDFSLGFDLEDLYQVCNLPLLRKVIKKFGNDINDFEIDIDVTDFNFRNLKFLYFYEWEGHDSVPWTYNAVEHEKWNVKFIDFLVEVKWCEGDAILFMCSQLQDRVYNVGRKIFYFVKKNYFNLVRLIQFLNDEMRLMNGNRKSFCKYFKVLEYCNKLINE